MIERAEFFTKDFKNIRERKKGKGRKRERE